MHSLTQSSITNRLLAIMSASDFGLLLPHLEPVALPLQHVIANADTPIEYAHFLDSGICSVVARRADRHNIEVGIVGREGMGGYPLLLGSDQTPHEHFMQLAGTGHRIKTAPFRQAVLKSESLRNLLLRFVHVFTTQTAQTALANGSSHIDQRLARWLLMCHDRIDSPVLPITHNFLAMMLAVRRLGVTDTIHILEGRGLIRGERGKITILDRAKLERLAGASYGIAEAEYKRLIGRM